MGPAGSWRKKHCSFFYVKSRTTTTQKLELGIQKVKMDGLIIAYVKTSDNPLMWPHTAIYTQFGPKKFVFD